MNLKNNLELLNLLKNASIDENDILKIKKINKGLTNEIYKILLKNNSLLKVRISNKKNNIDRLTEKKIEEKLNRNFLYYNSNGDYITNWINGKNISQKEWKNKWFWLSINNSIEEFRLINKEIKINYNISNFKLKKFIIDKQSNNFKKMYNLYISIINNIDKNKTVITHSDLSRENIIRTSKNKLYIIDFEWVIKSDEYWDIANLIKDFKLNLNQVMRINSFLKYDLKKLINIIFATHIYTIVWTFNIDESFSIKKYRKKILKKSFYWYKKIAN